MNDKSREQHEEDAGLQEGGKTATGGPTKTTDREQPSALGGDVATRSGTEKTPDEERAGNRGDGA